MDEFFCNLTPTDWIALVSSGASLLVAIATVCLAFSTHSMARATQKTLEERNKPYVIVYVKQRESAPSILYIVIENIGYAPAYDVKFNISDNLMWKCWGIDKSNCEPTKLKYGPFIDGIPMLVPNQKLIMSWGQYGGIKSSLHGENVKVAATFKNDIGKILPSIISVLSVKEFATGDASDSVALMQVKATKELSDKVKILTSKIDKKLNCEV